MPLMAQAEQWRLHPTYDGSVDRLVDTPDYTYLLSRTQPFYQGRGDHGMNYLTLFRYDKEGDEMQSLNNQNLLSENILQTIEYNPAKKYLMAVYDNGNIDLIYDKGEVVNVPGLKLAGSDYSKNVGRISFAPEHNEAYIPTDFGFLVLDDNNCEIKRTVNLGTKLMGVARIGNLLAAATEDALYYTEFKNYPKWDDFTKYGDFADLLYLVPFENRLYILYGGDMTKELASVELSGNELMFKEKHPGRVLSVERRKDGLMISGGASIWCVDKSYDSKIYTRYEDDYLKNMVGWSGDTFWLDNGRNGLRRLKPTNSDPWATTWAVQMEKMAPNASNPFKASYMTYSPKYGMLIRNRGNDTRFTQYSAEVPDLICGYKNGEWTPLSTTYRAPYQIFYQSNPAGVAVDPKNPDHVYSGSVFNGLMRVDLADPSKSFKMSRASEAVPGDPRQVTVHQNFTTWVNLSSFSAPSFDNSGNLWTAWFDRDKAMSKQDNLEFWYWTPADRAASADASSFRQFGKIKVKGVNGAELQQLTALKSSSSKNMLLHFGGGYEYPLTIYDTNGTLDNTSDDRVATSAKMTDSNGSFDLVFLTTYYEDPSSGMLWIGHDGGVFRLSPAEYLKNPGKVSRIKVSRNDGTGQADYLLDGVQVNAITADASGRKWFGTLGGGIVITSSDGSEVMKSYTTDNSPLPDNDIYGICYNPENNSMMISTGKGLAELFLSTSASDSSGNSDVTVYPNPVRPDYFGYVNIEGLQDNALVKVMDAHGNLVKELGFAAGGEIKWDVTNLNARRVPGGVYYILASGAPDSDAFAAVGKVLVVN